MINSVLAGELYEFLTTHPELHDQTVFSGYAGEDCKTTHCIAGWIGAMDGVLVDREYVTLNGYKHVTDYAQDRLGISGEHADILFWGTNNKHALDALYELKEGRLPDWEAIGVI